MPARATPSCWRRTSGKNDSFDQAITDFAERYADQNERDYEQFIAAIESGRLEAREGL